MCWPNFPILYMSVMILLGEHLPAGWLPIGRSGSGIVYPVFMTSSASVSGFSIVPPSSLIAMISPSRFSVVVTLNLVMLASISLNAGLVAVSF